MCIGAVLCGPLGSGGVNGVNFWNISLDFGRTLASMSVLQTIKAQGSCTLPDVVGDAAKANNVRFLASPISRVRSRP